MCLLIELLECGDHLLPRLVLDPDCPRPLAEDVDHRPRVFVHCVVTGKGLNVCQDRLRLPINCLDIGGIPFEVPPLWFVKSATVLTGQEMLYSNAPNPRYTGLRTPQEPAHPSIGPGIFGVLV